MPRLIDSQANPHDFCNFCFYAFEDEHEETYSNLGDGPDGRGNCYAFDVDHPPYEHDYVCEQCNSTLGAEDN